MVKENKLYNILGIDSDATTDDIKKAYRKLAIKYHPDRHPNLDDDKKAKLENKFKEITHAYETLSDEQNRAKYDQFGEKGLGNGNNDGECSGMFPPGFPFGNMGMGSCFSGFAFNNRQIPKKSQPIKVPLTVTLEDVYTGKTIGVKFTRQKFCLECNGQGGKDVEICQNCSGKGVIIKIIQLAPGMIQQSQGPCQKCQGEGKNILHPCVKCRGKKIIIDEAKEAVKIEKGVKNGDILKIENKGNFLNPKGDPGDVFIYVEIEPHNRFTRINNNLVYKTQIDLVDALCGLNIVINHLDGHQIVIKHREIIQPNQLYCINREGMPIRNSVEKGDLIVEFSVRFPTNLNDKIKHQIEQLLGKKSNTPIKIGDNHYETQLQIYHGNLNETESNKTGSNLAGDEEDNGNPSGVQCAQQ